MKQPRARSSQKTLREAADLRTAAEFSSERGMVALARFGKALFLPLGIVTFRLEALSEGDTLSSGAVVAVAFRISWRIYRFEARVLFKLRDLVFCAIHTQVKQVEMRRQERTTVLTGLGIRCHFRDGFVQGDSGLKPTSFAVTSLSLGGIGVRVESVGMSELLYLGQRFDGVTIRANFGDSVEEVTCDLELCNILLQERRHPEMFSALSMRQREATLGFNIVTMTAEARDKIQAFLREIKYHDAQVSKAG